MESEKELVRTKLVLSKRSRAIVVRAATGFVGLAWLLVLVNWGYASYRSNSLIAPIKNVYSRLTSYHDEGRILDALGNPIATFVTNCTTSHGLHLTVSVLKPPRTIRLSVWPDAVTVSGNDGTTQFTHSAMCSISGLGDVQTTMTAALKTPEIESSTPAGITAPLLLPDQYVANTLSGHTWELENTTRSAEVLKNKDTEIWVRPSDHLISRVIKRAGNSMITIRFDVIQAR